MNITDIFIKRPVLTTVLNGLICVLGIMAFYQMSVREYPKVVMPQFTITVPYPNASPEVVESEIIIPLEEYLSGIESTKSVVSTAHHGRAEVVLAFKSGQSMDAILNKIRDRLIRVRPLLPKEIEEPVVDNNNHNRDISIYLALKNETLSQAELVHLAKLHVNNRLKTIAGISRINIEGQAYEMHILLDRLKMYAHKINPNDVVELLKKYNVALPAGKKDHIIPITIDLTIHDVADFETLVVKRVGNAVIYLRDIADIKLAQDKSGSVRINGQPGIFVGVVPSPDSNVLDVSNEVIAQIPYLQAQMPDGVEIFLHFDKADFVRAALKGISHAIIEAILLVAVMILLFLKSFRSALIPLLTIPISLVGGFFILYIFGGSINVITLLAMVLAIGLVVDDAVVVLENIYQYIQKGLTPLEAAKKGSREISFAVIAMTGTLAMVYLPLAFIHGSIGQLFREFALTLSATVIVSGFVALTLTPMLSARILTLKQATALAETHQKSRWQLWYSCYVEHIIAARYVVLIVSIGILIASAILYRILPHSLAPIEDRRFLGMHVGMTGEFPMETLESYTKDLEKIAQQQPEQMRVITFMGDWGSNVIMVLKHWDERVRSAFEIKTDLFDQTAHLPVDVHPWAWTNALPGVDGSQNSDISFALKFHGSYENLEEEADNLTKILKEKIPDLTGAYHELSLAVPSFNAVIDRNKLSQFGLDPKVIANSLSVLLDESKPVHFRKDGIRYFVSLSSKQTVQRIEEIYVNTPDGESISLGTLMRFEPKTIPNNLIHYNQVRATKVHASFDKNVNFGEILAQIETILKEHLPPGFAYEFSSETEQYFESQYAMLMLFLLGILFVYGVLAIQFESFIDPIIILYTVPLTCFGGLVALWLGQQGINIYTQIGFVTLIGLVTKHGILLLDITNQSLMRGTELAEAVIHASERRARPIIMTTGTMILGTIPLLMSHGAGSEARHAIGIVLLGGLVVGTVLTLTLLPVIIYWMKSWQCRLLVNNTIHPPKH